VKSSAFRWISGEDALLTFRTSPEHVRAACGVCGAVAPVAVGEQMRLPVANLLGELRLLGELAEPAALHAFTSTKAPWHALQDGLPAHGGAPPGWLHERPELERPSAPDGLAGSCLCGQVTFVVTGRPDRWLECNCSRCRRGRSAAHGSNGFYPLAQFRWLAGQELVSRYKLPEAERFSLCFCSECAGGVPVVRDKVPFVLVPMGLLDQDPGFGPQAYIHVASKAPWYRIPGDLPQFAELPT